MALTPEEEKAKAAGFALPEGDRFIRLGDDDIRKNAVKAMEYAKIAARVQLLPSDVTSLDKLTEPGHWQLHGAGAAAVIDPASLPADFSEGKKLSSSDIWVSKPPSSNFVWQELRTFNTEGKNRIWVRQTSVYNSLDFWTPWERLLVESDMPQGKKAAVQINTPSGIYYDSQPNLMVRVPFRVPANVKRLRVHMANHNDIWKDENGDFTTEKAYSAPGMYSYFVPCIGEHKIVNGEGTGQFVTDPIRADVTSGADLSGSEEYVGAWMDIELEADKEYLIAYAVMNPNQAEFCDAFATAWQTTRVYDINKLDVSPLSKVNQAPLNVWLEVEVEESTKVVAVVGDSLSVGRLATNQFYDSAFWLKGMRERFIPRFYSSGGTKLSEWIAAKDLKRWSRFSDLPAPAEIIIEMGSNDIYALQREPGATVEGIVTEMKRRLTELVPIAREKLGTNHVYLCTILPRNNQQYSAVTVEALRQYNEWLQSLPLGALGCYNWASAVCNEEKSRLLEKYVSSDKVHLTTAGYAAVSGATLF